MQRRRLIDNRSLHRRRVQVEQRYQEVVGVNRVDPVGLARLGREVPKVRCYDGVSPTGDRSGEHVSVTVIVCHCRHQLGDGFRRYHCRFEGAPHSSYPMLGLLPTGSFFLHYPR